jgi:hypothetical protein
VLKSAVCSGCLLKADDKTGLSPILILDNLERVDVAAMFGPMMPFLAQRGKQHAFHLQPSAEGKVDNTGCEYYFADKLHVLATLNRTRYQSAIQ